MKLTTEQIAEFNARGVIIAREALTHDDLQSVIDELSAWIDARARTMYEEGEIADLHEDAPFATRYGLLFKQCPGHRARNGHYALSGPGHVRISPQ